MDTRLSKLINDYQARVAEAVAALENAGIARPASVFAWTDTHMPQRGELPGGFRYFKHGYGCAIHGPSWGVDFDFGDNGEIDGFDAERLCRFAGERLSEYGFDSGNEIEIAMKIAVELGEIRFSGYILYFLATPASEKAG